MHSLFVVTVLATPTGDSLDPSIAGAYVNVYANATSERDAIAIANQELSDAGWRTESIDKVALVSRADFVSDDQGLKYFDQAAIDGVVLVFHTFPPDSEEPQAIH